MERTITVDNEGNASVDETVNGDSAERANVGIQLAPNPDKPGEPFVVEESPNFRIVLGLDPDVLSKSDTHRQDYRWSVGYILMDKEHGVIAGSYANLGAALDQMIWLERSLAEAKRNIREMKRRGWKPHSDFDDEEEPQQLQEAANDTALDVVAAAAA